MYDKLYFGSDESAKQFSRDLRKEMTNTEAILWECLRNRRLSGLKFRRQHVIEGFIVDFYCLERSLVVEVDGGIHKDIEQKKYDLDRTSRLEELGLKVIRITNEDVIKRLNEVLRRISKEYA